MDLHGLVVKNYSAKIFASVFLQRAVMWKGL